MSGYALLSNWKGQESALDANRKQKGAYMAMTRIELLAEAAKMGLKVSVPRKANKNPQLQAAGYLAYAATCGSDTVNACPADRVEYYVQRAKEAMARIPSPTTA